MNKSFLDSSVVIGLCFRHAGERDACRSILSPDGSVCSSYVIYEVARGFLRSLIELHNSSYEFATFADLHMAAYSGQLRFKPYKMATWLGAFTDFHAALEKEDGVFLESQKLELFRAKLRGWIRRGWKRMASDFQRQNDIGCRNDLNSPFVRADSRVDQKLPLDQCGSPANCGVHNFIDFNQSSVIAVSNKLKSLPPTKSDAETKKRITALDYLLSLKKDEAFKGDACHRCGDALICLESAPSMPIATKNKKHFEPICEVLGKELVVAQTAKRTMSIPDLTRAAKNKLGYHGAVSRFVRWFFGVFSWRKW